MSKKIPLLVIVGPTASGKTALSVQLAKRLDGEIVSADSMQVYKDMSVATAVPSVEERCDVPHWMIEFLDKTEPFTVADYVELAHKKIKEIHARGKLPILVGGTGLYVDALTQNIRFCRQDEQIELRQILYAEAEELGAEKMHRRLAEVDPIAAKNIHSNDKKRILRALEIFYTTGQTKTSLDSQSKSEQTPYNTIFIGLGYQDREVLYDRINRRVDAMVEMGLLDEAKNAYASYAQQGTSAQAIGHKELFGYFGGECTLGDALELLKRRTRQYAKRQITWFNKNKNIHWIHMDTCTDPVQEALQIFYASTDDPKKGEEQHKNTRTNID